MLLLYLTFPVQLLFMCSVFGQQWSSEEEEDPSQALINIKPADMISSSK